MKLIYLILSIILGAIGQVFFKFGIDRIKSGSYQFFIDLLKNIWVYFGAASYGVSFLLWMKVLKYYDVSFARPLTSAGYVLTYFLAIIFLHEGLSLWRILGTIFITAGVFMLTMKY